MPSKPKRPAQRHERLRPEFGDLIRRRLDELSHMGYDTSPKTVASWISEHVEDGYYRHEYISRVMNGELGVQHLTPERVEAYARALTDDLPETRIPDGFDRARLHYVVHKPRGVSLEQYRKAFRPLEAVAS